jgi:DNA-binding SARP family transcriptional activator
VDFRLLGDVGLWDGDTRISLGEQAERPKVRCLLAVLLLAESEPVTTDYIDWALWGHKRDDRQRATRYTYVKQLRTALQPHGFTLSSRNGTCTLVVPPDRVDLHRFSSAVREANRRTSADEPAAARDLLHAALQTWHGVALAGIDGPWAQETRRGLETARVDAAVHLIEARLRCNEVDEAVVEAGRLVREHPADERIVRLLMQALYRSGDYAAAIDAYQALPRPGAPTEALYRRIMANDPMLGAVHGAPADTSVAPLPQQLPSVTPYFAGRRAEFDQMNELTDPSMPFAPRILIYGSAGVGKTTFAVHWARSVASQYPHGQLYADLLAAGPAGTAGVLRGFLVALGVASDRIPAELSELSATFRSLAAGRRMLIVLDNAEDAAQVRNLLPGTDLCLTLVTARVRLEGLAVNPVVQVLTLDVLDPARSHELLAARLGEARLARERPETVTELIDLCAGLPLALGIVAARAAERRTPSLTVLVNEIKAERGLAAFATDDPSTDPRIVFSWSYRRLNEEAARLFRLLSLHPGPDLTRSAAASLADRGERETAAAMKDLMAAHLVGTPTTGRFATHALLLAYARELAAGDAESPAATARLYDYFLCTAAAADHLLDAEGRRPELPEPAPGTRPTSFGDPPAATAWFRAEEVNLAALTQQALHDGRYRYAMLIPQMTLTYQTRQGRWPDMQRAQSAAVVAAAASGTPADEMYAHLDLARALGWSGRDDEARPHIERALALATGPAERYRIHAAEAWLFGLGKRYAEALGSARKALEAARADGDERALAVALNEIGWWHAMLGQDHEALDFCTQALSRFEQRRDLAGIAAASDSLGLAYHRARQFDAALRHYQRAAESYRRLQDLYELAATLSRTGDVCQDAGRPGDAATAWRESLALFNRIQHADGAAVNEKLSRTRLNFGDSLPRPRTTT